MITMLEVQTWQKWYFVNWSTATYLLGFTFTQGQIYCLNLLGWFKHRREVNEYLGWQTFKTESHDAKSGRVFLHINLFTNQAFIKKHRMSTRLFQVNFFTSNSSQRVWLLWTPRYIFTARNEVVARYCFYTCLSLCSWGTWWQTTPPACSQTPCLEADTPWADTPLVADTPGSRHPPRADTPQSRHPLVADTPLEQTSPDRHPPRAETPRADTPLVADTPRIRHPYAQCILGDTGNKREVRILLECILVETSSCSLSIGKGKEMKQLASMLRLTIQKYLHL